MLSCLIKHIFWLLLYSTYFFHRLEKLRSEIDIKNLIKSELSKSFYYLLCETMFVMYRDRKEDNKRQHRNNKLFLFQWNNSVKKRDMSREHRFIIPRFKSLKHFNKS